MDASFDLPTVDRLLTTTRAVRKRLDLERPVALETVVECLRIALQAPTGSNRQGWRWIVVTDPEVRRQLGELFRGPPPAGAPPLPPMPPGSERVLESAMHLVQHIQDVPVLVVPCIHVDAGPAGWPPSIYPAVWSFMLALRSRGLGSVLTTSHLYRREDAAELLGVPEGYAQSCMVPVAYYTGEDFRPARRHPVEEVAYLDRWGTPLPGGAVD